jgi:hypothetical protein
MASQDAIEVVAKPGGEDKGIAWAVLEYYMENNPRQTEWRKVPGVVVGTDGNVAMTKAEAIAKELSNLDIQALQPAIRELYESRRMYRKLEDAMPGDQGSGG